jgi:RNA polymerase sigma-70 factor, ECF subfamily
MQRELVLRAQSGDLDAFSTLTAEPTPKLYAAARLILRDDELAADAVQDAVLRAWIDIRALRDPDRFEAWLHKLLVRTCYAAAKRQRTRMLAEIKWLPMGEPSTRDSQSLVAVRDQLDRAFVHLSTDHRTVIVLVHYLGLSLAEAAQAIGVPLGTIQSRLSRATQNMRAALDADDRPVQRAVEGAR